MTVASLTLALLMRVFRVRTSCNTALKFQAFNFTLGRCLHGTAAGLAEKFQFSCLAGSGPSLLTNCHGTGPQMCF